MNINAGNPSLQNILLHNMKEKKRPTFSAVFEKLNKHSGKLNTKSPLNSVLTNEQMFRYYVKDTMPQLQKSNDTFGESEEGSMMSSLMKKLGLNEPSLNSNNIQTLEGTTNNLPFQMGDGSATAQGEPFVPDGSNNALLGYTPKTPKIFKLSNEEYDNLDFEYGKGAGLYVKEVLKYLNDPSTDKSSFDLETFSIDKLFEGDEFDDLIEEINNSSFSTAKNDINPQMVEIFNAVFGSGSFKIAKKLVEENPTFENMRFEDLVEHPQFQAMSKSSKSKSKYGFIDDIVNDMVDNTTGRHNFIDDIVNDMVDNTTGRHNFIDDIVNDMFDDATDDKTGNKEEYFDIDFLKVYHANYNDQSKIILNMTIQQMEEYQMLQDEYEKVVDENKKSLNERFLGGNDLRDNRFQNAKIKDIVFDDDFLRLQYADPKIKVEFEKKMTQEQYKEYVDMRREYLKVNYADRIKHLTKFEGNDLRDNRFSRQPEPITKLDGYYPEEFLKLYYTDPDERFIIESNMGGGIYAHTKMVEAYQNESEVYRKGIEKYYKKRAIDQPPPEQSITVRKKLGRPFGSKNKPRGLSVDIPPKPKTLGDVLLGSMMENMGAATKLITSPTKPKGAVKEKKSPLLRRVKDLE